MYHTPHSPVPDKKVVCVRFPQREGPSPKRYAYIDSIGTKPGDWVVVATYGQEKVVQVVADRGSVTSNERVVSPYETTQATKPVIRLAYQLEIDGIKQKYSV